MQPLQQCNCNNQPDRWPALQVVILDGRALAFSLVSEALLSASTATDGKDPLSAKPADNEDAEVASAAPDELDLEVDADMQPAHRAEALDVLASIELKFALLRERVYVEKMEGIAWEETLIAEGAQRPPRNFKY